MTEENARRAIDILRAKIVYYREQMEAHEEQRALALTRHDGTMVSYHIERWQECGKARTDCYDLLKKLEAKL